jgi:hypothetical protein
MTGESPTNPDVLFLALCEALHASNVDLRHGEVHRGSRKFSLDYRPPAKNTLSRFTLRLAEPATVAGTAFRVGDNPFRQGPDAPIALDYVRPVLLRRETRFDRIGKALLVNREAQTGDEEFDETVYVETDAPRELVERLLGHREVRGRVRGWLEDGWTNVRFHDSLDPIALISTPVTAQHLSATKMEDAFQQIEELVPLIPKVEHAHLRRPSWTLATALMIGSGIVSLVGWVLALIASSYWPPIESGPYGVLVGIGFLLWVGAVPLLGLLLRGRSDSFRKLSYAACLLGIGLPPLVVGLALSINGSLDESAEQTQVVAVQDLWTTSGKSTSYHIRTDPLDPGGKPPSFSISHSNYQRFRATGGATGHATITYHPGRLGWAWWKRITRTNP